MFEYSVVFISGSGTGKGLERVWYRAVSPHTQRPVLGTPLSPPITIQMFSSAQFSDMFLCEIVGSPLHKLINTDLLRRVRTAVRDALLQSYQLARRVR